MRLNLAIDLQMPGRAGAQAPPAGAGPASGPASQPQSEAQQRIAALLEAWTQEWRARQLPKLQAQAYRCCRAI